MMHVLAGTLAIEAESRAEALRAVARHLDGLANGVDDGNLLDGSMFTVRPQLDLDTLVSRLDASKTVLRVDREGLARLHRSLDAEIARLRPANEVFVEDRDGSSTPSPCSAGMTTTLNDIDATCLAIQKALPDATTVRIQRCLIEGHFSWDAEITLPRRDKNLRVMRGKTETLNVYGNDCTLSELVTKAIEYHRYQTTGKL